MKKTAGWGAGQSAAKHRTRDGAAWPLPRMTRDPGARQPAGGRARAHRDGKAPPPRSVIVTLFGPEPGDFSYRGNLLTE